MKTIRAILFCLLGIIAVPTFGQDVEYRNDSLFLNEYFIDATTTKSVIDSLLQSSGKTKRTKDKSRKNIKTGKYVKRTTIFYYDRGLFFRTYDYDSTKLSVGIKLFRETTKYKERRSKLKEPFSGQLYIAGNYINDKRQISQLVNLENCSLEIHKAELGRTSAIIGGEIVYKRNLIRLSFDDETEELTDVYIHHNTRKQ